MMRYFLYVRKSSESEDRQINSIPNQVTWGLKKAKELGLQIVEVIEEARSAKKPGRSGFNDMLCRLANGEADGVISWHLNRIARNPDDGGRFIWLTQEGVIKHVVTETGRWYSRDNLFMMYVEFGMSTQYSRDLGNNIRVGCIEKALRGWFPKARLPYGYKHCPERKNSCIEIVPDEERFNWIKELWKRLLAGDHSLADLKRLGDTLGLQTKSGKKLSLSVYQRMFRNDFYCGYFHWKDHDGVLVRHLGKHEAMVTREEFDLAQKILNRTAISRKGYDQEAGYAGLFSCGECGCGIVLNEVKRARCKSCKKKFSTKNTKSCPECDQEIKFKDKFTFLHRRYYRCPKRKGNCSQKTVSEDELTIQLSEMIDKLEISEELYKKAIEIVQKTDSGVENRAMIKRLKSERTKKEELVSHYHALRADGEMEKDEYLNEKKARKVEIQEITARIVEVETESKSFEINLLTALEVLKNASVIFKNCSSTRKRAIIRELGSNPIILDKKCYFTTPQPILDAINLIKNTPTKKLESNP